jgi:hypothetical protein
MTNMEMEKLRDGPGGFVVYSKDHIGKQNESK